MGLIAAVGACALIVGSLGIAWPVLLIVLSGTCLVGLAVHVQWRAFRRQQPIADLGDQLREISRAIPDGNVRMYASSVSGMAVECIPKQRGSDAFTRFDLAEYADVDRAEPGQTVRMTGVTYRVDRTFPIIWRRVWADEAVKGTDEGQYHYRAPEPAPHRLRTLWKTFLLDHRIGVLTPDRDELQEILDLMGNADRVWDTPTHKITGRK
ncbi:hypothetical protein ACFZCV_34260 [Streptomyces sp. NPDC007920]|uniref:hypothetical protein n=1 Tax=Streptomyces sp. NPDC007920 TaxID=3364794 RepID=UPI0036F0EB98